MHCCGQAVAKGTPGWALNIRKATFHACTVIRVAYRNVSSAWQCRCVDLGDITAAAMVNYVPEVHAAQVDVHKTGVGLASIHT